MATKNLIEQPTILPSPPFSEPVLGTFPSSTPFDPGFYPDLLPPNTVNFTVLSHVLCQNTALRALNEVWGARASEYVYSIDKGIYITHGIYKNSE